MKRLVLSAVCVLALAGCATPVTYGPATSSTSSGFSQQRIERDRFRVSFRGAGPAAQINDYALLRAAEVTLGEGYDWFQVVNRSEDVEGYGGRSGTSVSIGGGSSNYGWGRRSGVGVGVGTTFALGGGAARDVALEIKLGRGPTPQDRDVYDARSVQGSIRSRVR